MLNRNKQKIVEEIVEFLTSNPEKLWDIIENAIFHNDERMQTFEKRLDVAKAKRIAKLVDRKLDELTEKEKEMENSTEPWMGYVVLGFDENRGWKTRMAWNSAFIKKLKENGIDGSTDEERIQRYLFMVNSEYFTEE